MGKPSPQWSSSVYLIIDCCHRLIGAIRRFHQSPIGHSHPQMVKPNWPPQLIQ